MAAEKKKELILFTENYPYIDGEFFIDDEITYLSQGFEKIYIWIPYSGQSGMKRNIPENVEVISYRFEIKMIDILKIVPQVITPFFIKEFAFAVSNAGITHVLSLFKFIYMDLVKANKLKKSILSFIDTHNIRVEDAVLYSYWHDYKALALALLKNNNNRMHCIARAHGWDVFAGRHRIPYLPFKKFILIELDFTYSISQAGKDELVSRYLPDDYNKIKVARLGKRNFRKPNTFKKDKYILCSCSNLIPVKRVSAIIGILVKLQDMDISWVHFGDGFLKEELQEQATTRIPQIQVNFKGVVPNSEILDYYHENAIDLFLNVSELEGIPVSIMEALSAGIPVLATNVGGTAEIVTNSTGFLIEKDFDADEIAQLIRSYLLSSEENKLLYRKNAYKFWRGNYNAEQNYSKFVNEITRM